MPKLELTVATANYDRVRALIDGRVGIEGCTINYLILKVEEVLERAYLHHEFDIAEIGFSPYLIALSRGIAPYVAAPAFLSRIFRHSAVYIRNDRGIEGLGDLAGKRIGVPEYQMSAALWVRGMMKDEFGLDADRMEWVQAGLENAGRREKFPLNVPADFPLTIAPAGKTLSQMLAEGALDAVFSARAPTCFLEGQPHVRRLFPHYRAAEQAYFKRTGIFPIMHAIGIRRDLAERHPWLAASVLKAFSAAKRIADEEMTEVASLSVALPWVVAEREETEAVMGTNFWPYGVAVNRITLDTMARYSFEQGLSVRRVAVEEMFPSSTLEEVRV